MNIWGGKYSGIVEVHGVLSEEGGLGPLVPMSRRNLMVGGPLGTPNQWGPLVVRPKGNHRRLRHWVSTIFLSLNISKSDILGQK